MSLRNLPEGRKFDRPQNYQWDAPSDVLARWADMPLAAEADDANTISIYDVIGEDMWTGGGFTAKRAASALRSIGNNPVTVKINSPGGDMFEGIAIYNLFRDHPAKVTVEVMGIAASAASIIAMAGDRITMGLGTFMMVHNAWGLVIGNRHDMREAATLFDSFDGALADIYEARTGLKRSDVETLMDAETFMGPSEAVDKGFADDVDGNLSAKAESRLPKEISAKRRLESVLAQTGLPRVERRRLVDEALGGVRDAALTVVRDADFDRAAMERLIQTIRS